MFLLAYVAAKIEQFYLTRDVSLMYNKAFIDLLLGLSLLG